MGVFFFILFWDLVWLNKRLLAVSGTSALNIILLVIAARTVGIFLLDSTSIRFHSAGHVFELIFVHTLNCCTLRGLSEISSGEMTFKIQPKLFQVCICLHNFLILLKKRRLKKES